MGQADPEAARYLALGQRNAEAIELFERFCGNVRVELMGGRGMLEAATGLPIAHRAFRCAYASCACRKSHPRRLGGMSVLVEDAAEAVASLYAEASVDVRQWDG
jgi:hypothetical protein